ncbi:binding-protein-dependent transport systems inner membrane component [Rubrobacter xylanophilus DSM 9941]|uniref:Binding-protein-dependent transport systems inner membrane component n=1 Tax=Rubrobacter xylanophilus (strain DSM 9941 / JCM 11954 / NBRC 16129 / PRD-1) TaxID=266117 RepID=Q1AZY0_RUBXD|nr:carbohydrate ABC transporter permease [Rubrobacter xylanophilus]ABG03048.1 binding-protein-dependent transport systems inner membrane component [Rubrobacter xylanophilus DSM 9941]
MLGSKARAERLTRAGLYAAYAAITAFFLFPIFWVVSMSLKTVPQLFASPPVWFPVPPQFENYAYVLTGTSIGRYLLNSAFIVLMTVIFTLIIATLAAYGFSRFSFRYKRPSLLAVLVFQMVSPVVIAIPLYRFFAALGLLNSYATLILVYVAIVLPFTTWFLKGYFDTIPYEMDEAAIVDGASRWQVLTRILLPVCAPGIATAAILAAVLSWSQFVVPFILLDSRELYPISVGLVDLKNTSDAITLHYLSAASVIAIAPVIAVFVLLQRYIVNALTAGAIKG